MAAGNSKQQKGNSLDSFWSVWKINLLTQLVNEPTQEGTPLDLLFANRGLVGDVTVGGHLGHSNHKTIVFYSWRSKESSQQNCYLGLLEGRLWPVKEPGWQSPLGGSPEGQRSPGRLDILQEGNLKGTGAGHPHVLKDEPAGKKTSLAEQRALAGTQGKKKEFMTFGRRARQLRRTTRMS